MDYYEMESIMQCDDVEALREWIATEDALINSESPDEKLVRIPTHYAFWFSWFSFNEETELYRSGN